MSTCMRFNNKILICGSRGSSVSVVIRLRDGRSGGLTHGRGKIFCADETSRPALRRSACCLVGTGVKWTGREATHSFTSDGEVKNEWS